MDINQLAEMCVNIIRAQSLEPNEEFKVGLQILNVLTDTDLPSVPVAAVRREVITPRAVPVPDAAVIGKPGDTCTCDDCGQHVFTITKPVYDKGMSTKDFYDAFNPVGGAPRLQGMLDIENIDGNVRTDCPVCKGEMSLNLIGKAKKKVNNIVAREGASVQSIGGAELGME